MSEELTTKPERSPIINANGDLVIPFDSPERYHYWIGPLTIRQTLDEFTAPPEIPAKYELKA